MLNHQSPVPLYHQLAEILTAKISRGEYTVGSRIPSEHQLAAEYGIGRPTARQATDVLVRKRALVRKRGSGTFVLGRTEEVDLFSLAGTSASFQAKGIRVSTKMLKKVALQKKAGGDRRTLSRDRLLIFFHGCKRLRRNRSCSKISGSIRIFSGALIGCYETACPCRKWWTSIITCSPRGVDRTFGSLIRTEPKPPHWRFQPVTRF